MDKELRRAQHVVADTLTAMTRILDEDHSVRFKDGHINLIAVFPDLLKETCFWLRPIWESRTMWVRKFLLS